MTELSQDELDSGVPKQERQLELEAKGRLTLDEKAELKKLKRKRYNRQYYLQNQEELQARKARRYREDEEYREAMKKTAAARYEEERGAREPLDLPSVQVSDLEPDHRGEVVVSDPRDVRAGSPVEVRLFGVEQVARIVGRSVQAVRTWIQKGALPKPEYTSADFDVTGPGSPAYLYTQDEVELVVEARHHLGHPIHRLHSSPFHAELKSRFASELRAGLKRQPRS